MRDSGRWQLTDVQRLFVVLAVVSAAFLCAMSGGSGNFIPLLIALLLLVGAGLAVFLLGLRFNGRLAVQGYGHVLTVSAPPSGTIVGRCEMQLRVDLPGRPSTLVKLRDPVVPVIKWPYVNAALPIEVGGRGGRQLRVLWERVPANQPRATVPADEPIDTPVPIFTDYADTALRTDTTTAPSDFPPVVVDSPTRESAFAPVDEYDYPLSPTPPRGPAPLLPEWDPTPHVPAEPVVSVPTPPSVAVPSVAVPVSPLPDPAPVSTVPDPPVPSPRPQPEGIIDAEILNPDAGPDILPSDDDAQAPQFELPMRTLPQPRPEPRHAAAPGTVEPASIVAPSLDEADSQAMGIMLVVSDLARSLHFYRDQVGFTVVDSGANMTVLAYGEGRILLRQLADMSPVDRRVAHLHIRVQDVDSSYRDLKAKGVEFVHRPRVTSRGDKLDLWAATFRDPDGHDIALTQWRAREEG